MQIPGDARGGGWLWMKLIPALSSKRNSMGKQNLRPCVRVDQAIRPLPPKTLSISEGLNIKTDISVQSQLMKLETSGRLGLF